MHVLSPKRVLLWSESQRRESMDIDIFSARQLEFTLKNKDQYGK